MNRNNSINSTSGEVIPVPLDFPKAVPLADYHVVQLSPDLYFATQELSEDSLCPNGIFSMSVAVDRSAQAALTRARYEAAERFALAAILGGHKFIPHSNIDQSDVFEFPAQLKPPLDGQRRSSDTLFLEFTEVFNMERKKYVAAADVFAPYPIGKEECSWHPTTNGVAVGANYDSARLASFSEFLERHSIMQYWYEGRSSYLIEHHQLQDIAAPEIAFLEGLDYDLICLEISTLAQFFVILLFAKNRSRNYPFFVCSAGSALTLQSAVRKAAQETIQTLIACAGQTDQFLRWKDKGGIVNSLDHRMYFYSDPSKSDLIDQVVLDAVNETRKFEDRPTETAAFLFENLKQLGEGVAFIDITPMSWNGLLYCVRCYSSTMFPLLVSESMVEQGSRMITKSRFGLPHPFP